MFLTIALSVLFATILVAAARYGAGSVDSFVGLFGSPTEPRPRGVQEEDLAPFSFPDDGVVKSMPFPAESAHAATPADRATGRGNQVRAA